MVWIGSWNELNLTVHTDSALYHVLNWMELQGTEQYKNRSQGSGGVGVGEDMATMPYES